MKSLPFLLLIGLLFVGCQAEKTANTSSKKVFKYNQHNNITSLDPAFARSQANSWAIDHLYNGLVQLGINGEILPSIAKKWAVTNDGLKYTFFLKTDVFFHSNSVFEDSTRCVVASDFKYSFERILDDKVASPGSWIFRGKVSDNQPFIAVNDSVFELNLSKPFLPILGVLTMGYCAVVPHEAVEKYGAEFRKNPIGTGAFIFKKWLDNQALFLKKNENYFEKDSSNVRLPYLDGVKISFISDRKTAFLELMKGNLDHLNGLESSYSTELLNNKGLLKDCHKSKINFIKSPFLNTEYLGIRIDKSANNPLQIKQLRQALNYALDKNAMLKALRNNVGKAAQEGFLPNGLPKSPTIGYAYDPAKAAQLIKEAGFDDSHKLPKINLIVSKDYSDLCAYITRQWEELGIKVEIELSESATLRERMTKGEAPFFRASWIADYPDAESFFAVFYGKNPAPPNYTRFQNDSFDNLYEQLVSEKNELQRQLICKKMDEILIEEAPVIFLFYDESAVFTSRQIHNLQPNNLNILSLKNVKKD